MIEPEETLRDELGGAAICQVCSAPLPAARYVHADAQATSLACSVDCLRTIARDHRRERWAARRRYARQVAAAVILIGALLTPHEGRPIAGRRAARAALVPGTQPASAAALPAGWFGPEWPPTDASLLAELGRDAWIHPLAGPVRRMPRVDSRVFGAVRPGERPAECRNGHCGVDLGGEIWGEHVHAVHDGVVDFVQRGANPDRGGEFVRLAHHDGTVFTQYFHLAAIPRGLERGVHVTSGEVIGLLGDTGVKDSAPHLHFAISVRPAKELPERYIDPEPLLALWPVRVPIDGGEAGMVTTVARPGLPLGSAALLPGHRRKGTKLATLKRTAGEVGEASGDGDARAEAKPAAPPADTGTESSAEGEGAE
jgi:murein DD-endopeptidase MepM/ murein hydrolase activator NlpD